MYLSLGKSISLSTANKLFCGEVLETFVILSELLLLINSPVASAMNLIALIEVFYKCICGKFFIMMKRFLSF